MINNEVLAAVFIVLLVILVCIVVGALLTILFRLAVRFVKWVEDKLL